MANLFDLLDLADGESGTAAVSVLVTKKKAEAAAAEAAARAEAEAAREAAREAKRAAAVAITKAYAIEEIKSRRAAKAGPDDALPAVEFTAAEMKEIAAAVARAEREADEEKEASQKISYFDITQKQKDKRKLVDDQIQLAKEQSKLLEEQISLLEKQRKMAENNKEDVDSEAQITLEKEQIKLAKEQNKLTEKQQDFFEKRKNLKAYLGEFDLKYRGKELYEVQTKFREEQDKFLGEERNFWNEQRRQGRQAGYQGERNQVYSVGNGNGNGHHYNGGNDAYYNRGYNGNAGYVRGNGNDHYYNGGNDAYYNGGYNGNAGYGRGNAGNHYYNGSGGYRHYQNNGSYQFGGGYDERQTEGGEYYSGRRQGYGAGKARRQNWQRKDKAVSEAGTDAEHKPEVKVASASSATEQKAGAVNGEAVPASGSENSAGDAANGESGPLKKDKGPKVKLSGSQKRKLKRNAVAGSKKDAGNEMEKAKQDPAVDVSKQQIGTEPTTYFEEEKEVTLDEYEKVSEEKKKSLEKTTVVRKIGAEEFKGLQLLENKRADEEEAIKKAEKVRHKEKSEKVIEGAAKEAEMNPDAKKVADALFKHAPRPRYQDDRYNRGYNGGFQGPRADNNSNDSRGSGRGGNVAGYNGNGAPRGGGYSGRGVGAQRGGYSGGRDGYSGRGNGGYQGGYNGNGQYQQGGRGNGRFQQRGPSEEFEANFPMLN